MKTAMNNRMPNKFRGSMIPSFIGFLTLAFFFGAPLATGVDISQQPMSNKINPAPPSVMVVIDNSGSMDWEVLTTEPDGLFAQYGYVFRNAGDNNYTSGTYSYQVEVGDPGLWRAQWSGYNKMFFNPKFDYNPWAGKDISGNPFANIINLTAAPSNPYYSRSTDPKFNLTETFQTVVNQVFSDVVTVDNVQANNTGGSTVSSFGTWSESGNTPEHLGSSFWADATNEYFTWTPSLTTAGQYEVFAWWNDNSNRDQEADYTIVYSGGSTTVLRDQSTNSGTWVSLGIYPFAAGTSGSVTVTRTGGNTGSSTLADAVRFVRVSAVTISRAHYYVIDDKDGDGELDVSSNPLINENIFLVNFNFSGSEPVKEYYLYKDLDTTPDNRVESGELELIATEDYSTATITPVSGASETVPNSIRACMRDDDGTCQTISGTVVYKTAAEDLQNFANWYSYFRRRELTAKAAIGSSISKLSRVQIGFYSLHDTEDTDCSAKGARTGVLPLKLSAEDIIVDNLDSGFSIVSGSWQSRNSTSAYVNNYRRIRNTTNARARWTPTLPGAGNYRVYTWFPCLTSGEDNAEYTIMHAGTSTVLTNINQDSDLGPCGQQGWMLLGTYYFDPGNGPNYVQVREADTNNDGRYLLADAIRFEPVGGVMVDETDTLLKYLYEVDSSCGTPLRRSLDQVGRYFDNAQTVTWNGVTFASPYESAANGGECQQSFAIVLTDGFWNGSAPSDVGDADSGEGPPFEDPFATLYSPTLADVAMKYWKNDLHTGLADKVPENQCDKASWQHMVTYGVSFGLKGKIDPSAYSSCPRSVTIPWDDPTDGVADGDKIDDLYHATVNGRGEFFSAGDPKKLVDSLLAIFLSIESRTASGSSITANGENLTTDTVIYQSRFDPTDWSGDLIAYQFVKKIRRTTAGPNPGDPPVVTILDYDPASFNPLTDEIFFTGEVNLTNPLWQAADELQEVVTGVNGQNDRTIVTFNPVTTQGIPFRDPYDPAASGTPGVTGLTDLQLIALDPTWAPGNTAGARNLVYFLRGAEITTFRARTKALGDLIHSAPLYYAPYVAPPATPVAGTIFVGGNDGMLHAFSAETGEERFAYVPDLMFKSGNLQLLADPDYSHYFFVDGSPHIKEIPNELTPSPLDKLHALLVCGLGAGGKGYFALDVKDAHTILAGSSNEGVVSGMAMWEYGPVTDLDLGYSFSRAFTVKANNDQWVVIFGNGYDSTNQHAVLYILDAITGVVIKKIDTGEGGGNGLSTPTLIDPNSDSKVDYVYAGDLRGNLWKFDLTSTDPSFWSVAFNDTTNPQPLFRAGIDQPITTKPEVMYHCSQHGYMVVFGTGKFLGETDRAKLAYYETLHKYQSIFGIWDYGDDSDDSEYLGLLDSARGGALSGGYSLVKQTEVFNGDPFGTGDYIRVLSDNQPNYSVVSDSDSGELPNPATGSNVGWFFDFPDVPVPVAFEDDYPDFTGERVVVDPLIREGRAIVISFAPNASECTGGGWSMIHEVDACKGTRITPAVFDVNNDNLINASDLVQIGTDSEGNPIMVGVSGIAAIGLLQPPKIFRLSEPGQPDREVKLFNNEAATLTPLFEKAEDRGIYYWIEK